MAEQRLIDANDVYEIIGQTGVARVHVTDIDQIKRIDPETLPIVWQLREELSNCKQELRQIKYCYDIAKNGEKQLRKQNDEIIASWAECAKKLKQVTAERDAAVSDLNFIEHCGVCKTKCSLVDAIDRKAGGDCAFFEWRGPQKEEN